VKITEVKTRRFVLDCNDRPFHPTWRPFPERHQDVTVVEVHTDEGITGIGAGGVLTRLNTAAALFVGKDPLAIEEHWHLLRGIAHFMGRPWPIEIALWDIAAKKAGVPLAKLLGGRSDRLLAYCSTGEIHGLEQRVEDVLRIREMGFRAVKLRFHNSDWRVDLKTLDAVRAAVGDSMTIMVDGNWGWYLPGDRREGAWDRKTAMAVVRALEDYDVFWIEEPLYAYDYDGLAEVRASTSVRVAGGELNAGLHEFQVYLSHGSLDVYQPDCTFAGGVTVARKVAAMAEAAGLLFAPHTWTNGIGLAANLQVAAAASNCPFIEFPFDPPNWTPEVRDFMLTEPLTIDSEGYLRLPDRPGIGVELDEERLRSLERG
jgi:L-alanine-DL-glutamate epimerase-like enolase superfamily enzyme